MVKKYINMVNISSILGMEVDVNELVTKMRQSKLLSSSKSIEHTLLRLDHLSIVVSLANRLVGP